MSKALSVQRTKKGFSLIEVLVYIAVTVLIAGACVTTYLSLDATLIRNRTERILAHSASVSLERMVRNIRGAESINNAGSTFGTSPGALELVSGTTTTKFSISGDNLVVAVNGGTPGPLTSEEVIVRDLVFTRFTGAVTDMIRVQLTLSANTKAASTTRTFYTSAVLRGTYE